MMTNEDRETRALVVNPSPSILPSMQEMQVMVQLSKQFHLARGKLFPNTIDSPAMLYGIIEAGREVGIPPMVALREVFVVNGRTELSAKAMEGVVLARDPSASLEYEISTREHCRIILRRGGKPPVTCDYTLDDVPKQLRGKPGPWQEYGIDMLRWFTLKRVIRMGAQDLVNVTGGVSVAAAQEIVESPEYTIDAEATELPADDMGTEASSAEEGDGVRAGPESVASSEGPVAESSAGESPAASSPPADAAKEARAAVGSHAQRLGLKTQRELAEWLGLPNDCQRPFVRHWMEPAAALGLSPEQAAEIAMAALDAVAKEIKGGAALPQAVATVAPRERLTMEAATMQENEKGEVEQPALLA